MGHPVICVTTGQSRSGPWFTQVLCAADAAEPCANIKAVKDAAHRRFTGLVGDHQLALHMAFQHFFMCGKQVLYREPMQRFA